MDKNEKFDFYDQTYLKSYNLDTAIKYQLNLLDSLDAFTRKHSENVATLTCNLCKKLHCSKGFTEYCTICAYLHDIGKQFIPTSILQKKSTLTDEEYEIMKTHVVIGKNILDTTYGNKLSNNIIKYARDIVYHHHEKYDGTGYPEKLKGEEISIISRIMALIDVYDALANPRVYKPAMPYKEVEEFIKDQSGRMFDPKIVNIFEMVKDELKQINEENKD